jgi:hypothetical protein
LIIKKEEKMKVTKEVLEVLESQGLSSTYLYNNRLLFSRLISKEEYNFNHTFLKKIKQ